MDNKFHTYKEIFSQTDSFEKIYEDIVEEKFCIDKDFFLKPYDEIILFGCGSSYNLSQSASFFTKSLLNNKCCIALPSSELLTNTDIYINKGKKYLVIGFSRSGETTESINVIKKLIAENKNITAFTFSCNSNSTMVRISDYFFVCRDSVEKSIVMTKSFSSMLYAYCLILTKSIGNKEILFEFKYLTEYLSTKMKIIYNEIYEYLSKNNFKLYFVLGNGFNYGLAVEADLKMKEMSQIPSFSYNLFEFCHGPISLINNESLCIFLTINKNLLNNKLIIDNILKFGAKVLIIGQKDIEEINNININYLLVDSRFKYDNVRSFINIPVFQMIAYIKTVMEKLNPDTPRNLSYTTKI